MARRARIPAYDGEPKKTGTDKRQAAEKKRLSDTKLMQYRPYFVTGRMELADVANLICDDLGLDEPKATDQSDAAFLLRVERKKVLTRLTYFAKAQNWHEMRRQYVDRLATAVEVRMTEEAADLYLAELRSDGDSLLATGMLHAQALQPFSMGEALDMIKVGATLGLRGRNLPEKISGVKTTNVNVRLEEALVEKVQNLGAGDYAALADSLDAAFTEPVAGRPAAGGGQFED